MFVVCRTFIALSFLLVGQTLTVAQVTIYETGASHGFTDIGFDPVNNEIVLVGNRNAGVSGVASVFHLSSDHSSFRSSALTGLGPNTVVTGVSPNGSWISGYSDTSASDANRLAIAWQSPSPSTPISAGEIATLAGWDPETGSAVQVPHTDVFALEAWNGGVVGVLDIERFPDFFTCGDCNSGYMYRWDATAGTTYRSGPFSYDGSTVWVRDVSADGTVVVGATYIQQIWFDETGTDMRLPGSHGSPNGDNLASVSPNGERMGGKLNYLPTVWTNNGFESQEVMAIDFTGELGLLLDGVVEGVSDSGYAYVNCRPCHSSSDYFIWHESFNGIDSDFVGAQDFDAWLLAMGGITIPDDASRYIAGMIEDDGVLHIAVNGSDQAYVVSVNIAAESGLRCDAAGGSECTVLDIDALYAAFGTSVAPDSGFDYTGDGLIDADDITGWLADASQAANVANLNGANYVLGDVDFDGNVNSVDLGLLLNNFNEDGGGWGGGDLDGDEIVNSADLGLLLNNFNFSSPLANVVPEPTGRCLLVLGFLAALSIRRRR